jgi:hypothetical protein|tara:strand:- start:369 stop:545 length:177 start_codon:yes stop_codon:yes gene_type:complete
MAIEKWQSIEDMELETLLITIGSYLYNDGELVDVDVQYLKDLNIYLDAEIEKRGATIH